MAPVLGVPDVGAEADHLADVLGFAAPDDARFGDPDGTVVYAIATLGPVEVHLQRRPAGPPVEETHRSDAYVTVSDVDALHAAHVAAGADVVRPLQDEPYGRRDYTVRTPQGLLLTFADPD